MGTSDVRYVKWFMSGVYVYFICDGGTGDLLMSIKADYIYDNNFTYY